MKLLVERGSEGYFFILSGFSPRRASGLAYKLETATAFMNLAILVVRILVGLIFVVFGLNGFFRFIPLPPKDGRAAQFMGAINGTGYMVVVYLLQIAGGALLLANFHVPLGLLLLGPVVVNVVLFHVFLDPKAMLMAAPIGILAAFLLWAYWPNFARIFY